jgi:hypothetical protein
MTHPHVFVVRSAIVGAARFRQHSCARDSGEQNNNVVDKVYSRTFQKAVELLGDRKTLARELQVPMADLEKWIAGSVKPPMQVFLKAIDLVLDETSPQGGLSDPSDSAPSRECSADGHSSLVF